MDHRWDESTWQDRAARAERERFGTSQVERDPDVERRDQRCLAERLRLVNQSPWAIGRAWYDQRDTYTKNAEIDASGYGCGPSIHPPEGSYAYHRELRPGMISINASHASLYEKQAWPWLLYKDPEQDPYFAHLHLHEHEVPGLWQRLKEHVARVLHVHIGKNNETSTVEVRSDDLIAKDVDRVLSFRGDLDASDIEVSVRAGEVTLEGTVKDRRSKRFAAQIALGVRGVRDVHNRLAVRRNDPSDSALAFMERGALVNA